LKIINSSLRLIEVPSYIIMNSIILFEFHNRPKKIVILSLSVLVVQTILFNILFLSLFLFSLVAVKALTYYHQVNRKVSSSGFFKVNPTPILADIVFCQRWYHKISRLWKSVHMWPWDKIVQRWMSSLL